MLKKKLQWDNEDDQEENSLITNNSGEEKVVRHKAWTTHYRACMP